MASQPTTPPRNSWPYEIRAYKNPIGFWVKAWNKNCQLGDSRFFFWFGECLERSQGFITWVAGLG